MLDDVHFVVGAIFDGYFASLLDIDATVDSALLRVEIRSHILTSIREFVFEACFEAFVQVVVWRILREVTEPLSLVKYLTHQDTIHTDCFPLSKVHHARVRITFLEEEVLKVLIDEVNFHLVHSLVYAFQDQVVPVWTQ